MVQIKNIESKVSSAKKNITIKDAVVKELRFVDETGDVTNQVLEAIPKNVETITIKISVDLLDNAE